MLIKSSSPHEMRMASSEVFRRARGEVVLVRKVKDLLWLAFPLTMWWGDGSGEGIRPTPGVR